MAAWRDTLTALYAAHRARLEAFVRRRGGTAQEAPDLAQEAFLRLLAAGGTGSAAGDARMLYAIARNATIDLRKSQARRGAAIARAAPEQLAREEPNAEAVLHARRSLDRLLAAMRTLPETTQRVVILRRLDGLPVAEIARQLDIPQSTVEKHLARAMRHCAAALAEAPPTR